MPCGKWYGNSGNKGLKAGKKLRRSIVRKSRRRL